MKTTYHVSQRGSNSHDQIEYDICGHRHKTIAAAIHCLDRLQVRYSDGSTSVKWYHADIRNDNGDFVEEYYLVRDAIDAHGTR